MPADRFRHRLNSLHLCITVPADRFRHCLTSCTPATECPADRFQNHLNSCTFATQCRQIGLDTALTAVPLQHSAGRWISTPLYQRYLCNIVPADRFGHHINSCTPVAQCRQVGFDTTYTAAPLQYSAGRYVATPLIQQYPCSTVPGR